ncbi:MAG: hypothetical protein PHC75_07450 [Burkholderiales bacterium]|nr:hypothetical protein [Burkholderiales bacterium]
MESIEVLLFVGLIILTLIFLEIGRLISISAVKRGTKTSSSGSGPVETIVFGLLGLLIAFTFTGAESRLEYRRLLITNATNTISTAYARIELLNPQTQPKMRKLLKEYTLVRAKVNQDQENPSEENLLMHRSNDLQNQMWQLAVSECHKSDTRTCDSLLLPALNDVFSVATLRQAALLNHPPLVIYILLVILGLFGALLVGYALPVSKKRNLLYMITYAFTISILITIIIDMEMPRSGFVRVDSADQLLIDLGNGM